MVGSQLSFTIANQRVQKLRVEVQKRGGFPKITLVGSSRREIRDAGKRVFAAFKSLGLKLPLGHWMVHLSPSDIEKRGTAFDLALAMAILELAKKVILPQGIRFGWIGELSLDGSLSPVEGSLQGVKVLTQECDFVFVPRQPGVWLGEGRLVEVSHLKEVLDWFSQKGWRQEVPLRRLKIPRFAPLPSSLPKLCGQKRALRALEIACAGHHHLMMTGNTSCGKSMLSEFVRVLLPLQGLFESSFALGEGRALGVGGVSSSSLREVALRRATSHMTLSQIFGSKRVVGEVQMAQGGVLWIDELREWERKKIESLRYWLEERREGVECPFLLVACSNDCPCGRLGESSCGCSAYQIERYQAKISQSVCERVPLHVQLESRPGEKREFEEVPVKELRQRIWRARKAQEKRGALNGLSLNQKDQGLTKRAKELLHSALHSGLVSLRGYDHLLGVARTIADLAGEERVKDVHMAEALSFRELRPKALACG